MLRITDEVTFHVHGKVFKLSKNALGFLSNKSRFRIILVWIVTWKYFDRLVLLLIVLNSLSLGMKDYLDPNSETEWNQRIDYFEPYFTTAFVIECVMKIFAYGFYIGKKAYLKEAWNWLDFIVVIVSLLEQYIPNASGLRTFRLFRPLRSLNNVKSMQLLVETLFLSLLSLGGIMGLAIFFFTIFSILGISQWRGLTHYRCRQTEFPVDGDWLTVEDDAQLCFPGVRDCPVGWCGSLFERYDSHGDLHAVEDLYRDSQILELNYGVTNFDNLGYAFITIFQCITMEGWTTVMYMFQDVTSYVFCTLYFMSCVIICSFFLLNLTIAVMLMQYDELEQRNANSIHKTRLRHIGRDAQLPIPLIEFLIKQSNLQIGKEAKNKLKKLEHKEQTFCQKVWATEYVKMDGLAKDNYYMNKIPRFFYAVSHSNIFAVLIMGCILLNTLVLSMDRYPAATEQEMEMLAGFNMFFNIVFSGEVLIKMIGLGLKLYVMNIENLFDFFVVTLSWVELALGAEGGSSLGALRAIRLFRVFKLFKSGDLRILMDSILFTISTIGTYTVLLMLFLYVFALTGMQFFAGQFRFKDHGSGAFDLEEGEVPRANFDTLIDALLTTFACFIGDNWTFVMYDSIRSSGSIAAIFYVIVIAFGNIVMLNLFLAILLGNFDKARDFGAKKKLLQCFQELQKSGYDLSQSIDMILHDLAEYTKFNILKWDRRVVGIEREQPSRFLRSMMARNANFMDRFDITLIKQNFYKRHHGNDDNHSSQGSRDVMKRSQTSRRHHRTPKKSQISLNRKLSQTMKLSPHSSPRLKIRQTDGSQFFQTNSATVSQNQNQTPRSQLKATSQNSVNEASPQSIAQLGQKIALKPDVSGSELLIAQDKSMNENSSFSYVKDDNHRLINVTSMDNCSKDVLRCPKKQDPNQLRSESPLSVFRQEPEQNNSIQSDTQRGEALASDRALLRGVKKTIDAELDQDSQRLQVPEEFIFQNKDIQPQIKPVSSTAMLKLKRSSTTIPRSATLPPAKKSTQIRRQFSLMASMRNIFVSKVGTGEILSDSESQKKVLAPSGYSIKRTKEYRDLKKLITESQVYVEDQNNYHMHVTENFANNAALSFRQPNDEAQGSWWRDLTPGKRNVLQQRRQTLLRGDSETYQADEAAAESLQAEVHELSRRRTCCSKFCNSCKCVRLWAYMRESSLFIFHKDFKIRKMCLKLLEVPSKNEHQEGSLAMDKSTANETTESCSVSIFGKHETQQLRRKGTTAAFRKSKTKRKRSDQLWVQPIPRRRNCFSRFAKRCCPSLSSMPPNKWFDNVILCLIFTSSVMLALDNPLNDPNSLESKVYKVIDLVHTVLFTGEMLIKIIGLGFFSNTFENQSLQPYVRSTWNCLDFFVVISSLAELAAPIFTGGGTTDSFKSLKALRALRALRPLRMVSKNEGMKLVVGALMTSIPSMTNVLVVCLLLLLIMAIVGVNLFKGKFFYCSGLTYEETLEVITKSDCIASGGDWLNNQINFDHVINAMLTLFQMMTTEGWQSVMYSGIDAVGIDKQPKKDYQPMMALYFVVFMIIGSQFIINLFVGVVIDNFNKIKEKDEMGNCFVTQDQRSWIEIQKICLSKNLIKEMRRPKGYQITFTKLTEHMAFEYFITGCILANTIAMAMVSYREPTEMTQALEMLNYFFTIVFNIEMILKLLAQGKTYFRVGWNIFDCFIVFGTNAGLLLKAFGAGASMGATTSVIRGFRIMRIFRLVKASMSMRLIIDTIMNILPQITNIMSLMCILLFIYAALGINLFSAVIFQDELNKKNNFRTFGNAMVLLMRCATGEDWHLIMYELAISTGYGEVQCREQNFDEQQADGILGCGDPISYVYFFSYVILITMLIMNLAVAAVIQGLNTACAENLGFVSSDDVNHFIDRWRYYDPQAKGWISADSLVFLLFELNAPLGRKKAEVAPDEQEEYMTDENLADRYLVHREKQIVLKKKKAISMLKDNLHIRMHRDKDFGYKVHYMDVLKGLLKRILNEKQQDYKLKGDAAQKISSLWTRKHKDLKTQKKNKIQATAAELGAVRIIENWITKKLRNNVNSKQEARKTLPVEIEQFQASVRLLRSARTLNQKGVRLTPDSIKEQGHMTAKELENEEIVSGGVHVLQVIEKQSKKESKLIRKPREEYFYAQKKMNNLKADETPERKDISFDFNSNKMNMDGKLWWINEETAKQLADQVEDEERLHQLLKYGDGIEERLQESSCDFYSSSESSVKNSKGADDISLFKPTEQASEKTKDKESVISKSDPPKSATSKNKPKRSSSQHTRHRSFHALSLPVDMLDVNTGFSPQKNYKTGYGSTRQVLLAFDGADDFGKAAQEATIAQNNFVFDEQKRDGQPASTLDKKSSLSK